MLKYNNEKFSAISKLCYHICEFLFYILYSDYYFNKDNISDYVTCKDYKNRQLNVNGVCFTKSLMK